MPGGVNLGSAYGKIVIDGAGAVSGIGAVQSGLMGLQGGFGGVNPLIVSFGAGLAGAGAVAGGFATAIGLSVDKAADLEAQLDSVQALTGATTEEMDALRGVIDDLSLDPELKVSAFEAADAIEKLSSNGMDLEDVMEGGAKAVVLLANATGAEFAPAATTVTDVMALFNIEAENMVAAVDSITGVVNESKFEFEDYQLALAQGGGVAASFGISLEDFNATIAATSAAFASGSDAGTSYKTFLQRLIPQSEEAAEVMNELGLEFFDAEGKLKGMPEIAKELNRVFGGTFTTTHMVGEATEDMMKAAGKAEEKIPKLTTKMAEQEDELVILQSELANTITKYGEGSDQANRKRLAITKLTNDINENKAELAKQQAAIDAVNNASAEAVTVTRTLTEEERNKALTTLFGADAMRTATGLIDQGQVVYTDAAQAAKELGVSQEAVNAVAQDGITAFEVLQLKMGNTSAADAAATRMGNLRGAIEILNGIIESVQLRIGDAFIPLLTDMANKAAEFLSNNADGIIGFFEGIATSAESGTAAVQRFVDGFMLGFGEGGLEGVLRGIELGFAGLISPFDDVDPAQMAWITTLTDGIRNLVDYLPSANTAIVAFGGALTGAGIVTAVLAIVAAIVSLTNPVTALVTLAALLGAAWATNWGGIRDIVSGAITTMQPYLTQLETLLTKFNDLLLPRLQLAWNQLAISWTTQIAPALAQLWAALNQLFVELGLVSEETSAWDAIMGLLKITMLVVLVGVQSLVGAIAIWADMVSGAIEGATSFVRVLTSIKSALDSLVGGFTDVIGKAADFASQMASLSIPDWLTPGSPPPLAYALWDIGDAVSAVPDLGQSLAVTAAPAASLAGLAASPTPAGGGGGGDIYNIGDINLSIDGSRNPEDTARAVRQELENIFNRVRSGSYRN